MLASASDSPDRLHVLDQEIEDMAGCAEALGGWDLDFRQLEPGPLRGRITVVAGRRSGVARIEFNRRFHQLGGAPPQHLTFGLPEAPLPFCGVEVCPGVAANFNRHDGFECSSAERFVGYALMLEPELLHEAAGELGLELDLAGMSSRAALTGAPGEIDGLRRNLAAVIRRAQSGETLPSDASVLLEGAAPETMARAAGRGVERQLGQEGRRRIVRAALEVLDDGLRLPIKVKDLCGEIGVSAPTIYRAFQDELGIGPKQYIRARCLAGVQRELLNPAPGTTITDTANRWGFWHMGDFASDYRRQFGELPSETLSRHLGAL